MKKLVSNFNIASFASTERKQFDLDMDEKGGAVCDIAIVGAHGMFAGAQNLDQFWEVLANGVDCITDLPLARKKDCDDFLAYNGWDQKFAKYSEFGYLNEVDKFDCHFFKISPAEANLMDPNQRMFLETAWKAIEDAGYGGDSLVGSNTGVFIGHSNDFCLDYRQLIQAIDPSQLAFATAGNIKSIIASRISYLLDLKGPSVVIDTACSSALVAVHMACQSIKNGECENAIVGGIKINPLPLKNESDEGIGIQSKDGRAKTFDHESTGTGGGEGVGALLIKPLANAVADGDRIYAVIKGSAINQDGRSIGITAPNASAQEQVIRKAWREAGVDPASITYIETHGTATKLGDPIEIEALSNAFSHFTDRKQFCAIGSVKSNVGHLDNAAGIVGLMKLILALKHKKLPPTLHFNRPNALIHFEDSPLYVNDCTREWVSNESPHRCAISSFGLSGTNCHLVLEEYGGTAPVAKFNHITQNTEILTLSAKSEQALRTYVRQFRDFLCNSASDQIEDIIYTANAGRGHYKHRLAIIVKAGESVADKLNSCADAPFRTDSSSGVYYGEHIVVTDKRGRPEELTHEEQQELSGLIDAELRELNPASSLRFEQLETIAFVYCRGGQINWHLFYHHQKRVRTGVPTYPFDRHRYWLAIPEPEAINRRSEGKPDIHPMLDELISDSLNERVWRSTFDADRHWLLNEHMLKGVCLAPGTSYIELVRACVQELFDEDATVRMQNLIFLSPLFVHAGEKKEVFVVVRRRGASYQFTVYSESNGVEQVHAEGEIELTDKWQIVSKIDWQIDEMKHRMQRQTVSTQSSKETHVIQTGPRWDSLKEVYTDERSILAYFELPKSFENDMNQYLIHPALLDCAVNVPINSVPDGKYLPFSYKRLTVHKPLPPVLYSYTTFNNQDRSAREIYTFDIVLFDPSGVIIAEIESYSIKRFQETEVLSGNRDYYSTDPLFHQLTWMETEFVLKDSTLTGPILVLKGMSDRASMLAEELRNRCEEVYEVTICTGERFKRQSPTSYLIGNAGEDYERLFNDLSGRKIEKVVHLGSWCHKEGTSDAGSLERSLDLGVRSMFHIVKSMISARWNWDLDLITVVDNAYQANGTEAQIHPHHASLAEMMSVIALEHPHIRAFSVDAEESTSPGVISDLIGFGSFPQKLAIRDNRPYQQKLSYWEPQAVPTHPLRKEGVYVVTGGSGGMGREISRMLAEAGAGHIAWISRTVSEVVREEAYGAAIIPVAADVSDYEQTEHALRDLRSRYGSINGIVHAAGVAGEGFLFRKEIADFNQVLKPKIQGTWVLDKLTATDQLDFFILCSSITAFLGGPGQSDYTAANAYMDAFAFARRKSGKTALSLNWAPWSETGMAVKYNAQKNKTLFKPLTNAEAIDAIRSVLHLSESQIVIGRIDAEIANSQRDEMKIWLDEAVERKLNAHRAASNVQRSSNRPVDAFESGQDIESIVGRLWCKVLGIRDIHPDDNFSDLGGDSIIAVKLLRELETAFPGKVDITDVYTYPTVRQLVGFLEKNMKPVTEHETAAAAPNSSSDLTMEEIMDRLSKKQINPEEAERLIASLML